MRRFAVATPLVASFALLLAALRPAVADDRAPAELLPDKTPIYVEVGQPKDVLDLVLDHPLRKQIEALPAFEQALRSPKFKEFRTVVGLIENRAGVSWRQALEASTGGGLAIAFDPAKQGTVLLMKPADPKAAHDVRDALFFLVRDDAKSKGDADPIATKTYRGLKAYHAGEAIVGDLDAWTLISNKPAFAKAVADTFLDGGKTLAHDELFSAAQKFARGGEAPLAAWGFVRLAQLRALAAGQPWLDPGYKSDNPGAELLFGGLIPAAQRAPYVTATLQLDANQLKLTIGTPWDRAWAPAARKFYFATAGDGAAEPLRPEGMLLTVSTYRDLAALWQAGPDLFSEGVAAGMAQADSTLSTLLGGKSFSTEVLGAIRPQLRFVVARQDFKAAGIREPAIRLPGAALVLGIQPGKFDTVRRHFRVGFQSLVAFANIDGSSKGRPLLEIQSEKRGDADIQFATYSQDEQPPAPRPEMDKADKAHAAQADIYLNFSPALVMSRDHLILSSTRQLAEELADLVAKEGPKPPTIADNTAIEIAAAPTAELIRDNRAQLVAQNMLEKGHDRAAAEKEIDLLQTLVGYFDSGSLRLLPDDKSLQIELELKLAAMN